jgi:hypothetical protein
LKECLSQPVDPVDQISCPAIENNHSNSNAIIVFEAISENGISDASPELPHLPDLQPTLMMSLLRRDELISE